MGRGRLQKNYDGEFRTEMSNFEWMDHVTSWRRWPYSCLFKRMKQVLEKHRQGSSTLKVKGTGPRVITARY